MHSLATHQAGVAGQHEGRRYTEQRFGFILPPSEINGSPGGSKGHRKNPSVIAAGDADSTLYSPEAVDDYDGGSSPGEEAASLKGGAFDRSAKVPYLPYCPSTVRARFNA